MALKLLILGSGSALPTVSSNQTSQVLSCDNQSYLIDCGEGTQVELRRNKVKIQNINHIFISHLHGDHFFGLVGLLSTMHLLGRKKALHIHGPIGLQEIIELQFKNAGSQLSFLIHFYPVVKAGTIVHEDKIIKVTAIPLKHRIPCYGFLFEEKQGLRKLKVSALAQFKIPTHARKGLTEGEDYLMENGEIIPNSRITNPPPKPTSYAYCSDTAYYEKIVEYITGVDLLYHEATFMEKDKARAKKTFHSTALDAAKIAAAVKCKKLLIGHISNRYPTESLLVDEAKTIFENTSYAEEGREYMV